MSSSRTLNVHVEPNVTYNIDCVNKESCLDPRIRGCIGINCLTVQRCRGLSLVRKASKGVKRGKTYRSCFFDEIALHH